MKRVRIIVHGDVQGIGFRSLTQHRAKRLGVNGWVKNNPDGTVETVFEGEDESVNNMIEFCKQGTSGAYVEKIELKEEDFKGEFKEFRIIF